MESISRRRSHVIHRTTFAPPEPRRRRRWHIHMRNEKRSIKIYYACGSASTYPTFISLFMNLEVHSRTDSFLVRALGCTCDDMHANRRRMKTGICEHRVRGSEEASVCKQHLRDNAYCRTGTTFSVSALRIFTSASRLRNLCIRIPTKCIQSSERNSLICARRRKTIQRK